MAEPDIDTYKLSDNPDNTLPLINSATGLLSRFVRLQLASASTHPSFRQDTASTLASPFAINYYYYYY